MEKPISKPRFLLTQTACNLRKWGRRFKKTVLEPTVNNSVTFVGHSTLMYDFDGVKVVTDPMLYNQIKHIRKNTPIVRDSIPRRFDVILLTHFHMDHFHIPSLKLLDKTAEVVVPHGMRRQLEKLGFTVIHELNPNQTVKIKGIKITAISCEHDGRRYYTGPIRDAFGYLIESSSHTIFSCGDTAITDHFNGLKCDIAFMPVGCYTPSSLQDRHCSPEQSYFMFQQMQAKKFVPIHFGTLQLALDNEELTLCRIRDLQRNDPRVSPLIIGKNYKFEQI
ncbi:MAG: MBL fold metallo-hydrolase [Candidatus Saccharibacteria bacterium]|nr:MBL fold metallo-hydrolase [Candidatus Saccharibacteria bacterium]